MVVTVGSGRRGPQEPPRVVSQLGRSDLPSQADRVLCHLVRGALSAFLVIERGPDALWECKMHRAWAVAHRNAASAWEAHRATVRVASPCPNIATTLAFLALFQPEPG